MKKCKVLESSDKEVATILIWQSKDHKVGIILLEPYVKNEIRGAYLINEADNLIIDDLLNKANLKDKGFIIQCN